MTEAEQFAACDAAVGNTMLVFEREDIARRYAAHRARAGVVGLLVMATDTRTLSGLCVMWRDPVPPGEFKQRLGNCLWLLEETLAGRSPWPEPETVTAIWRGGQRA